VDGKRPSSPISGLRVSSIDLEMYTTGRPFGGARRRKFDISLWVLRAVSIRMGNVSHGPPEPTRKGASKAAYRSLARSGQFLETQNTP
jgi:hypothetical protein